MYLDGNSLGRPPRATSSGSRGSRRGVGGRADPRLGPLARGPRRIGDLLGTGAARRRARRGRDLRLDDGQLLPARQSRPSTRGPAARSIVTDRANFPTDRYVLEGLARDRDREIAWLDPRSDRRPDRCRRRGRRPTGDVALVTLCHVNYRSAAIADLPAITGLAHEAGALVLWDLSHSAGSVPVELAEQRRRPRGRLHVQVPQRRARRARLPLRPRRAPGRAPQPDPGLVRAARPVRDGPGLRTGSRGSRGWLAGTPAVLGLAAAEEGVGARRRGGHRGDPGEGHRPHRVRDRAPRRAAGAARLHDRQSRATAPAAARTCRSASPMPRRLCRELIAAGVIPDFRSPTPSGSACRRCTRASWTSGTASTACAYCWSAPGEGSAARSDRRRAPGCNGSRRSASPGADNHSPEDRMLAIRTIELERVPEVSDRQAADARPSARGRTCRSGHPGSDASDARRGGCPLRRIRRADPALHRLPRPEPRGRGGPDL